MVKEGERSVMRTLGILGGMSWESTAEYYRLINRGVAERLGGLHSARLLMHSVDFADVAALQRAGDWRSAGAMLGETARRLESIGADAIVLATNTMHQVAGDIEAAIGVPLIHIVDPTGEALARQGVRRAGLLGTRYTMELPFWRERLGERYGIDLAVPGDADRALVHRVIFEELCVGRIDADSRAQYVAVTERLREDGAEAVIFGCTEIGLLLKPEQVSLPAFDTTALHAAAAVSFSLGDHDHA
jgi:aspartate racemase